MKKIYYLALFFTLGFGCSKPSNPVELAYKYQWKYGEGFYLNDFIYFDEQLVLTEDSIIRSNGKIVAKLVSVDEKYLLITDGKQVGTYCYLGPAPKK